MVLLDTHVWIWIITGDDKIRKSKFLAVINKAVNESAVMVSAISAWEVSMLAAKGRITLTENTLEWIKSALAAPGLSLCPLSPEIACESAVLPGDFQGDPADRIIVASARVLDATLLTFDKQILKYARKGFVKFVEPK